MPRRSSIALVHPRTLPVLGGLSRRALACAGALVAALGLLYLLARETSLFALETVTIQGQSYLKRNPLGVLALTFITLGIYGLYWYYKANEEILRYTKDDTISPARSLLAVFPGFLLIVPPFIAYYNTSNHIVRMQEQRALPSQISPALVVILGILIFGTLDGPIWGLLAGAFGRCMLLLGPLVRLRPVRALRDSTGFAGVDGAFRFDGDGIAERALEVREVTATGSIVVSPAPRGFN